MPGIDPRGFVDGTSWPGGLVLEADFSYFSVDVIVMFVDFQLVFIGFRHRLLVRRSPGPSLGRRGGSRHCSRRSRRGTSSSRQLLEGCYGKRLTGEGIPNELLLCYPEAQSLPRPLRCLVQATQKAVMPSQIPAELEPATCIAQASDRCNSPQGSSHMRFSHRQAATKKM